MLTRHLVAIKPIRYERVEYKIGDTLTATEVDANYFLTRGLAKEQPAEPKKFVPAPEPKRFVPEVVQVIEPVIEAVPEPVTAPVIEPFVESEPVTAAVVESQPVTETAQEAAPTPRRRGRPRSILGSLVGTKDEE